MMWRLLLLLLLLAPLADAGADVREWHMPIRTTSNTSGVLANETFVAPSVHDWNSTGLWSTWIVQAKYFMSAHPITAPQVRYTLLVDGESVCNWDLRLSAASPVQNPSVALECRGEYLAPGNHSTEVTVAVIGGQNSVERATTTITLRQTEAVDLDIHVSTVLDAFLPYLAWLAYLVLTLTLRNRWLGFTASLAGAAILLLPADAEGFVILAVGQGVVILYKAVKLFGVNP